MCRFNFSSLCRKNSAKNSSLTHFQLWSEWVSGRAKSKFVWLWNCLKTFHISLSCAHAAIKKQKKYFFYSICKKVSELMEEYLNNIKLFCVLWNHRVELNFMYVEREREQKRAFLSIHNITNLLLLIHS